MSSIRNLLITNFVGLSLLVLLSLGLLVSLAATDTSPVTIIGFMAGICALVYFGAMLAWNTMLYRAGRRVGGNSRGQRIQGIVICIIGVALPVLFVLLDLLMIARYG